MTLLDRFRTPSPQHHADPAVRLAHVAEIPLDAREAIAAVARGDQDPRVRKAAVSKLLDPMALGEVVRHDADESVKAAALAMLRDIALEAFEGVTEAESLDAVEALADPKTVAQIARSATRDVVALRALSAVTEGHALGGVARHAVSEAARLEAVGALRERADRAEILAVAMNSEHRDTAVAAVDWIADHADLEQIAARGRNKSAVKRARVRLQEARDRAESIAAAAREQAAAEAERELAAVKAARDQAAADAARDRSAAEAANEPPAAPMAALPVETSVTDQDASVIDVPAADDAVPSDAPGRVEARPSGETEPPSGFAVAQEAAGAPEAPAAVPDASVPDGDAEARARREAVGRLRHLAGRVEPLIAREDLSLKAAERAVRDLRSALSDLPSSGPDLDEVLARLKTAQAALDPRVAELREATEWRQWANVGIQEQLCTRMEALAAVEDPEAIARAVRELQQQWRAAAEVPRAQADALWRRFKAGHDVVWPRCEAHFAAEAEIRIANLARKTDLCEKAEALADSTNWIQTADAIKALQAEWKTIGPVSRGREKAIWDRFRSACDRFFTRRHADLAERKKVWAENFTKKEALCVQAEALAESTDWEVAAADVRRLQAEWKAIGPVKKSRSEAIWQRFRTACDRFFARYASRHDTARAERVAAREAICADMEALSPAGDEALGPPADLLATVRAIRQRWSQEVASRGVDPDRARELETRLDAAINGLVTRWPEAFAGTELDPETNRKRMEQLVQKVEDLLGSLTGPGTRADASVSPTERLAAMLKEALAANTIGGKADDDSRWRAAADDVRQARAAWSRLGVVAEEARRPLAHRFNQACARLLAGRDGSARPGRDLPERGDAREGRDRRPRQDRPGQRER